MKEIKLSQGKVALVDDEDFEYLNQFKWCYSLTKDRATGYARRNMGGRKNRSHITMHQEIAKKFGWKMVDHKDRNGLNNQKSNLRECSEFQNRCNTKAYKNNTSGYRGVWRNNNRWVSEIRYMSRKINIGTFTTKEAAALAYNEAAKKYHGEFARLNAIQEHSTAAELAGQLRLALEG